MKNNFKKLIAASLLFSIFTITSPTLAMNPPTYLSEDIDTSLPMFTPNGFMSLGQLAQYRREKVEEFESIAPGIFQAQPEFKTSVDCIREIAVIFETMTTVLKKYSNITRRFIEHVHSTTEDKFLIRFFEPYDIQLFSIFSLSGSNRSNVPVAHYIISTGRFELAIFGSVIYAVSRDAYNISRIQVPVDCGTNIMKIYTAHEMGHLLTYSIAYDQNKSLLPATQKIVNQISIWMKQPEKSKPTEQEIAELQTLEIQTSNQYLEIFNKIKQQIITIAKTKYKYKGEGFITPYGEVSSTEWLAEVFAHAVCSEEPNPLGKAMLEYLDNIEKTL